MKHLKIWGVFNGGHLYLSQNENVRFVWVTNFGSKDQLQSAEGSG